MLSKFCRRRYSAAVVEAAAWVAAGAAAGAADGATAGADAAEAAAGGAELDRPCARHAPVMCPRTF